MAVERPLKKRRRTSKAVLGDSTTDNTKTEEEVALEKLLFGGIATGTGHTTQDEDLDGEAVFELDAPVLGSEEDSEREDARPKKLLKGKQSVWQDPADAQLTISLANNNRLRKLRTDVQDDTVSGEEYHTRLRKQFKKLHPTPNWVQQARAQKTQDADADDRPLASVIGSSSTHGPGKALKPGKLKVLHLKDANQEAPAAGKIHSVEFHPHSNTLLCGSADKRIRLFQIDGAENPMVQSVHLPELPLSQAQFHPSGSSVLMTGHTKPWLYNFDLRTGIVSKSDNSLRKLSNNLGAAAHGERQSIRFSPDGSLLALSNKRGHISLLKPGPQGNCASAQYITDLKTNGQITDLAFGADSSSLLSFGDNSEVYLWDLRKMGSCLARWKDEGGFGGLSCRADAKGKYLALGSKTGIVNVYDAQSAFAPSNEGTSTARKPLKALGNLTTPVDALAFNHDSQLLCTASSEKADAMRMVHLPSLSVFSNWPTAQTPLSKVTSMAFSQQSEYLAIGNTQGRVVLYLLEHFKAQNL